MKKTIEIPDFMNSLAQSEIDKLSIEASGLRVISCGVDLTDNCLYVISDSAEIRKIAPNGSWIPMSAEPIESGTLIRVSFRGLGGFYSIDSRLFLINSDDCLNNASLHVNNTYMCDVEVDPLPLDSQEANENKDKCT